jgi:hypothetical protein
MTWSASAQIRPSRDAGGCWRIWARIEAKFGSKLSGSPFRRDRATSRPWLAHAGNWAGSNVPMLAPDPPDVAREPLQPAMASSASAAKARSDSPVVVLSLTIAFSATSVPSGGDSSPASAGSPGFRLREAVTPAPTPTPVSWRQETRRTCDLLFLLGDSDSTTPWPWFTGHA